MKENDFYEIEKCNHEDSGLRCITNHGGQRPCIRCEKCKKYLRPKEFYGDSSLTEDENLLSEAIAEKRSREENTVIYDPGTDKLHRCASCESIGCCYRTYTAFVMSPNDTPLIVCCSNGHVFSLWDGKYL